MPPELPRVTTANLFADYVALLDLYAAMLGPQPTGVGGNEDERLLAGFAVKLFQHLTTMLLLSNEETVRVRGLGIDLTLMDHPSAMVVARAALETYVVFAYLFDPSVTEDERSLRRDSWELYDLLQRQEFIASEPFARAQLEEDAEQIAHLGERLKLNPSLKLLKSKEQKAVLSGDWRARQSWKEIGELVGTSIRDTSSTCTRTSVRMLIRES